MAPSIADSTREERLDYVRRRYPCIADCDACGLCRLFHGQDAERALVDYIDGKAELASVMMGYRGR